MSPTPEPDPGSSREAGTGQAESAAEPAALPAAGWYAAGEGFERWWDGQQWSEATRQVEPAATATESAPAATPAPNRAGWVPWVIAGSAVMGLLLLGIVGYFAYGYISAAALITATAQNHSSPSLTLPPAPPKSPQDIEAEEFLAEQRQPDMSGTITARTPGQEEFVADLRRIATKNGAPQDPESESIMLKLTIGFCEAAVRNGHNVDPTMVHEFIADNEYFQAMNESSGDAEKKRATTRSLMYTTLSGTTFICKDDSKAFLDALEQIGDNW